MDNITKDNIKEIISEATVLKINNKGEKHAVLHIVVGNDDYVPSIEDLQNCANLFSSAGLSDICDVVATNYHTPMKVSPE